MATATQTRESVELELTIPFRENTKKKKRHISKIQNKVPKNSVEIIHICIGYPRATTKIVSEVVFTQ